MHPETVVLENVYWTLGGERPWINVADNGTVVYVPGNPSNRHAVWVDRQGRAATCGEVVPVPTPCRATGGA